MSITAKNMYELLPAFYRSKDAEQGYPLKAFMAVIAGQAAITEKNVAALYENWFIETCEEWVVPYIGDLLGVRNFHAITGSKAISQRAYVANTLSYRRRKGIAPVLEQLSMDIAGWRAHVTEFFQLLATTQYMNHIRLQRTVTPDLRSMNELDLLNSAFETNAHSADVRHIASGRGKYNIPNIGLFLWRLQSYPVIHADARVKDCVASPPSSMQYFTFSPLGYDLQLFNRPQTETNITHLSSETNVAGLLRRRALFDELEARRQAIADGTMPAYNYFDDRLSIEGDPESRQHPVFEIFPEGSKVPVPPEEIIICNMEQCCIAPKKKQYRKFAGDGSFVDVEMPITVAVDPVLGRFVFSNPPSVKKAKVSYAYGFSGDTGSGTYNRQGTYPDTFQQTGIWQAGVSTTIISAGDEIIFGTVKEAVDEWNNQPAGKTGIITIMDSHSYAANLDIVVKEKSQLLIIAADWPLREQQDGLPGQVQRNNGDITASDLLPHIAGNITVSGFILDKAGVMDFDIQTGGTLSLNGLLIEGRLSVLSGNLGGLKLNNCTLVPAFGGLEAGADTSDMLSNQWMQVTLDKCICGPLLLHGTNAVILEVADCIADQSGGWSVQADNVPVNLKRSTFSGKVRVKTLYADNCIFNTEVQAARRQTGCMRFCFVPLTNSATPRRFRCQPELEITARIASAEKSGPIAQAAKDRIVQEVTGWLVPGFTSLAYGHHAYFQLNLRCPEQISTGADDGAEMGAFNFLQQPQRLANLHIALNEYLPLGLEAGIIYVT